LLAAIWASAPDELPLKGASESFWPL